jgi:hypothetical protein
MSFVLIMMTLACYFQHSLLSMSDIENDVVSQVVEAAKRRRKGIRSVADRGLTKLAERFSLNVVTKARGIYDDLTGVYCCTVINPARYDVTGHIQSK